jgi:hypothetical protein
LYHSSTRPETPGARARRGSSQAAVAATTRRDRSQGRASRVMPGPNHGRARPATRPAPATIRRSCRCVRASDVSLRIDFAPGAVRHRARPAGDRPP